MNLNKKVFFSIKWFNIILKDKNIDKNKKSFEKKEEK